MPQATSRTCPSCGRVVPRTVAKCRCGQVLPDDPVTAGDESGSKLGTVLGGIVLVAALIGTGYWTLFRTETRTLPTRVVPGSADPGLDIPQTPPAAAATAPAAAPPPGAPAPGTSRTMSAEQLAWNTAVGSAPPPAAPEPAAAPAPAPEPAAPVPPPQGGSLEDMIDRAMPAIVLVETSTGRGSAFFVQYDTLITNVHVVQQDPTVTLRTMNGTRLSARVHSRAPGFDIAVLKVSTPSGSQPYLPMGTAATLKPGQEVVVIGSALGMLQNSVSRGIVSGLRNSGGVTLVQSDAAANPGNSGGPMLDRNGRVVGVLTGGFNGNEGLNFAVSIDHARDVLDGKNLNAAQGNIGGFKPTLPGGGESDRRAQGEAQFKQRIDGAMQAVTQLDEAWQRFRSQCYQGRIAGVYDREWIAVLIPGAVPGTAAAGCSDYYQSMSREVGKFRDYMRQVVQEARRNNVLPGTMRDELRAKRLTHDWER